MSYSSVCECGAPADDPTSQGAMCHSCLTEAEWRAEADWIELHGGAA